MNPWEKGVWCLTIGLTGAVLVKLWVTGLVRIYKLLFLYLASDFLSSIVGTLIPFRTTAYGYYYFSAQTLKIVIAAFMLVEIYSLALERHPALARFGRNVVGYILLVAAALPLIDVWWERAAAGPHPYLRAYFQFEKTMDAAMAIFLILISLFMLWFPVRLRRNVIAYIAGFIVWSLSRSAYLYIIGHGLSNKHLKLVADTVQMFIVLACLVFWVFSLRREGEVRTAVVGHLWDRAEAEKLAEQLDTVNQGLARLRRR